MTTSASDGSVDHPTGATAHPPETAPGASTGTPAERRNAPAAKAPARLVKLTSPVARQLAGRRWFPLWAVLRHRGRRSGHEYAIPVAVLVTPRTFVIGLPWGPQTNWARNVLAAGGCVIRWKARDYQLTGPRLVGPEVALEAATGLQRHIIQRVGFRHFLQLQRSHRAGESTSNTLAPEM